MSEFKVGDLVAEKGRETNLCGTVTEIMQTGSLLVRWGDSAFPSLESPFNLSHYSAPLEEDDDGDRDVISVLKEAINNARIYGWDVSCTISKDQYL